MSTKTDTRPGYNVRSCPAQFTTRDAEDGSGPIIDCYFAVYNTIYPIWPGEDETIAPGAFDGAPSRDVRALIDHDTRLVLGRTTAGTLTLDVDARGLHGVIKVNEADGDAMNLYARIQRGDVNQCSFGFDIDDIEYIDQPNGTVLHVIKKVTLYEVSIVTFPAYEETSAQARSLRDSNLRSVRLDRWKEKMKRRIDHARSKNSDENETA